MKLLQMIIFATRYSVPKTAKVMSNKLKCTHVTNVVQNYYNMTTIEFVGATASILSILNQFPQAIKVFRTKDTHSISLLMYCIVVVCITMWLVYGLMLNDGPLIWANAVSLIPIVYIFIMKVSNTIRKIDKLSI
jgi:MtN3 and saliva related transmembrane protein